MSQYSPYDEDTTELKHPVKKRKGLLELLLMFAVTAAVVFGVVLPFIVAVFLVPSESMVPTLLVGDRVLTNEFIYRYTEPKRGQIIVFKDETNDSGEEDLVKRVLGLPGDEIESRGGMLFINGVPQKESYLNLDQPDKSSFGPQTIPPEHVFVMGDNRANSDDSRVIGPVPEKDIVGEVFLRVWPPTRIGLL